jgi:hypothetical protein
VYKPGQNYFKMKPLLCIFILFIVHPAFSQDSKLRTYNRLPVDTGTCVFDIELINIVAIDSLRSKVRKSKIEKLISYLKSCKPAYAFQYGFEDREITLDVPAYLVRVTYESGDQNFSIVLRDTSVFDRCIVFSYDFDDSYKTYFLSNNNKGFKKTGITRLKDNTIHKFINWDNSYAGTLFSTNHLHVSYFTKSKNFEDELEKAISRFHW